MKTDNEIRQDVIDELLWEPFLQAAQVGVAVKDGIVTLSGIVDSYSKKVRAEKAAQRVAGVRAVAEDIQVGNSPSYNRTDAELAEAVLHALKWNATVPEEKIRVKVENGGVQLEGQVDWEYQRNVARRVVENLNGVKFVTNLIRLNQRVQPANVSQKISAAFQRSATVDSSKIRVEADDSKVTLKGSVRSFAERKDAEDAAWAAPGVTSVNNQLEVDVPRYAFDHV